MAEHLCDPDYPVLCQVPFQHIQWCVLANSVLLTSTACLHGKFLDRVRKSVMVSSSSSTRPARRLVSCSRRIKSVKIFSPQPGVHWGDGVHMYIFLIDLIQTSVPGMLSLRIHISPSPFCPPLPSTFDILGTNFLCRLLDCIVRVLLQTPVLCRFRRCSQPHRHMETSP